MILFFFQYLFKFLHLPDVPALEIDLDVSREFLVHKGLNHIDDLFQLFHGFRVFFMYISVFKASCCSLLSADFIAANCCKFMKTALRIC